MKRQVITAIAFLTLSLICYSQESNEIISNDRLGKLVDSVHHLNKAAISNYNNSYYCCVIFKKDSEGKLVKVTVEDSDKNPMPASLKAYVSNLFLNCGYREVGSNPIPNNNMEHVIPVALLKTNQDMGARLDDTGYMSIFTLVTTKSHNYSLDSAKTLVLHY